ncbi:MAG TPA: hypothetical protein VNV37_07480 [Solirubrobacteraceae bacterium]|nr:hypothetical protein [Solirubrobacteraceae bacterium]
MLDTSVVVEALLPSEPGHVACVAFLRRLTASGCLVVFNRLLQVELHETLFNVALKERHGKRWASARYDGRVRRRAGRLLEAGAGAWSELLDSLAWSSIDLSEVVEDVPKLMRSYDAPTMPCTPPVWGRLGSAIWPRSTTASPRCHKHV